MNLIFLARLLKDTLPSSKFYGNTSQIKVIGNGTVVAQLSNHPKVEGLSPTNTSSTGRHKITIILSGLM
jgi:hypothetical protein